VPRDTGHGYRPTLSPKDKNTKMSLKRNVCRFPLHDNKISINMTDDNNLTGFLIREHCVSFFHF